MIYWFQAFAFKVQLAPHHYSAAAAAEAVWRPHLTFIGQLRLLRSSTRQTFTDVSDVKAIPRTSFLRED